MYFLKIFRDSFLIFFSVLYQFPKKGSEQNEIWAKSVGGLDGKLTFTDIGTKLVMAYNIVAILYFCDLNLEMFNFLGPFHQHLGLINHYFK